MQWPQAQDYNEAVQAPHLNFTDPALKRGTVKTNALGIPSAISGAFASVYEVSVPNDRVWAVRVFVRQITDQQRRYEVITAALQAAQLPYTVSFSFQPQGIRVNGATYPIVKMEFLRGDTLSDYVKKHIANPTKLRAFAEKWRAMVNALSSNGFAHGDLQHGNVLVVNDEPRLIDYDGFYVPALRGFRANELGHPNYQHPRRSEADFGPFIDNFSAWVIYISLRTLSVAPELYSLAKGFQRDECLLFNREDFTEPLSSPFINSLKSHHLAELQEMGRFLDSIVAMPFAHVPPLDGTKFGGTTVTIVTSGPSEWWKDHVASTPAAAKQPSSSLTQPAGGAQFPQAPSGVVNFGDVSRAQCEAFIALCLSIFSYFTLSGYAGIAGFLVSEVLILSVLRLRLHALYIGSPEAQAAEKLRGCVQDRVAERGELGKKRAATVAKISEIQSRLVLLAPVFQKQQADLQGKRGEQMREAQTQYSVRQAEMMKRRQALDGLEAAEYVSEVETLQRQMDALNAELAAIKKREDEECRTKLQKAQSLSLKLLLARHTLDAGTIPGIGEGFTRKLALHGIVTAADVELWTVRRIKGFGEARSQAVLRWRDGIATRYLAQVPTSLPASEVSQIRAAHATLSAAVAAKIKATEQGIINARQTIAQKFKQTRASIEADITQLKQNHEQTVMRITAQNAGLLAAARSAFENSQRAAQIELSTHNIAHAAIDKQLLEGEVSRKEMESRAASYSRITFPNYVTKVLLGLERN